MGGKGSGQKPVPAIERLLARIEVQPSGCWLYTPIRKDGYGTLGVRVGSYQTKSVLAHRFAFEHIGGRELVEGHEYNRVNTSYARNGSRRCLVCRRLLRGGGTA